ncbi:MAG: alpha/beta fold hydrolase [Longimicrobiales bacterium]
MENGAKSGDATGAGPGLAHEVVIAEQSSPLQWVYFLHGIFGAGRNWGTVARRLVEARRDVGAVLVDLREHGGSRGFEPPHTVTAAAGDLCRLVTATGRAPTAVVAHSFGGKVALAYTRACAQAPDQLWLVDATPAARPEPSGDAWTLLGILRSLPDEFESRDALIDALGEHGTARPVAQWIATNLERVERDGGATYRWRFDLDALESLLRDFFREDLTGIAEDPPSGLEVHVIRASTSSVLDEDTLDRLERAAAASPRVHLHRVEGGHWLNLDNPDALLELLIGSV